jgi:DNA-binding Lrp family transcriptional regulator
VAIRAYVLISVIPGLTKQAFAQLSEIGGVIGRHEVVGPYDIVLKLEAPTMPEFTSILGESIRTVPGIESTTTLVALPTLESGIWNEVADGVRPFPARTPLS